MCRPICGPRVVGRSLQLFVGSVVVVKIRLDSGASFLGEIGSGG